MTSVIKYHPEKEDASVNAALTVANDFVIATQEDLEGARDILRQVKALGKQIIAHHEPIKRSAKEHHSLCVAAEKRLLDPLQQAEAILKGKAGRYIEEQDRLAAIAAQKEQDRLNKEREKRFAAAQTRVAKLVALAGKDGEAVAALRLRLESDEIDDEEAGILRSQIALLENKLAGSQTKAQEIEQSVAEEAFSRPNVVAEEVSVSGLSTRGQVTVEVVNLKELCRAIGAGEVGPNAVVPVAATLKALAKSGMNLPGCKITKTKSIAIR